MIAEQIAQIKRKPDKSLLTFFGPKLELNPSTVSAPMPVTVPAIRFTQPLTSKRDEDSPPESSATATSSQQSTSHTTGIVDAEDNHPPATVKALQTLHKAIQRIPANIPLADRKHRLANFAGDPQACVDAELDDWADILSPMFKQSFGWGVEEHRTNAKDMLECSYHLSIVPKVKPCGLEV
jgi:hypothetical protein